jgi:hypothetical protein
MIIDFHKNFRKGLGELSPNQKKRVGKVLDGFEKIPHDPALDKHALHGKERDKRSFSVGGYLRKGEGRHDRKSGQRSNRFFSCRWTCFGWRRLLPG